MPEMSSSTTLVPAHCTVVCKIGFPFHWNFNLVMTGIFGIINLIWLNPLRPLLKNQPMTSSSRLKQRKTPVIRYYNKNNGFKEDDRAIFYGNVFMQ